MVGSVLLSTLGHQRLPIPCRLSIRNAIALLLFGLMTGITACGNSTPVDTDAAASTSIDDLTFNNIRLDQTDEQGRPLWQVRATKALYSRDRQVAQITKPRGQLFQDGKVTYRIQASTGEIRQNGQTILLRGQVVATDVRDQVVLRGNELEWKPKVDELTVRQNLTVTHKQLKMTAKEATAYSRKHQLHVLGSVIATAVQPPLKLVTERVVWEIQKQQVVMDRPIQLDHTESPTVVNRVTANRTTINLKTQQVTLKQQVQLLQLLSGKLQGQLNADQLVWLVPNQLVTAEGNVTYRRLNPPLFLQGPRAVGRLNDETVVISGGRVVTEIAP